MRSSWKYSSVINDFLLLLVVKEHPTPKQCSWLLALLVVECKQFAGLHEDSFSIYNFKEESVL